MRKCIIIILLLTSYLLSFSQEADNTLTTAISNIKVQYGDSIARNYLDSKKDSLEQIGENSTYLLLWGLLTSNMWNSNPSATLKEEYKAYLDLIIDEEIKSESYAPTLEFLPSLWQLVHDYYNILYTDGDKDSALQLLTNIHRWFEPYPEARNTIGYARSLLDLCLILVRDLHNYKEGAPLVKEYVQITKSVYGEKSPEYAVALYNYATVSQTDLSTSEKIDILTNAITIYEQSGNPDSGMYQQMKGSYDMLVAMSSGVADVTHVNFDKEGLLSVEDCTLLVVAGQGMAALESLLEHKNKLWEMEPLDTLRYAAIVNLITQIYTQSGNFASAQSEIENFDKSIGINSKSLPAEYLQLFYSNAGIVAWKLKDYVKALRFEMAACRLFEQIGDYGMEYAKTLANIAMIYAEAGEYKEIHEWYLDAKWYIDEATSIFEERIGPLTQHGEIGITLLSNKAIVYNAIGNREEAIKTLEFIVNNFSEDPNVKDAWTLAANNLSTVYMKSGRWEDGSRILKGLTGKNNNERNYLFSQNLALCYLYQKDAENSITALERMNNYATENIDQIFSSFNSIEREDYWSQISKELILLNNLIAYHTNKGEAVSLAYNNSLFCRNLLLNSHNFLEKYFTETNDKSLKQKYEIYKQKKSALAFKSDSSATNRNILSREVFSIEKDLLKSAGSIGEWLKNSTKTWEDVRASLDSKDIAIEFCYAPRMEHYPELEPYYGVFVLRKDFDFPILIQLENVDTLESLIDTENPDEVFINDLYNSDRTTQLYKTLWEKIDPYLKDIKTIYYSPTGYLANVNFDILKDEGGTVMNEKFNMVRVSSTANIADVKLSGGNFPSSSILYGNIKYDISTAEMAAISSEYENYTGEDISFALTLRSENERGRWGAIPSTKDEIDHISKLMSQKGVHTIKYEGSTANEESFKALSGHSPAILHLATHGFVIDAKQRASGNKFAQSTGIYSEKESYMMWAGLMLAGGNNKWQGNFTLTDVEDGILTADEISQLDLSSTQLVVLSACETAKGKIDPVDGVFGLQRAFKMAGAKTIVMSLWKVQDDATSMLMTRFYTYLTGGTERHQALWKAMMDVREKYKDPYYWAGFVMLD